MEFADVTFVNRTQLQLFVDRDSFDDGAVFGSHDDISLINNNARRSARGISMTGLFHNPVINVYADPPQAEVLI